MTTTLKNMAIWLGLAVWDKVNVVKTWRDLRELGRKYGLRMFVAAVIIEVIEDIVLPAISCAVGLPHLVPIFIAIHLEPVLLPVCAYGFKKWDAQKVTA